MPAQGAVPLFSLLGIKRRRFWQATLAEVRQWPMPKVSKQSVDYSLGMKDSHCAKTFYGEKGLQPR
jgi:hypothetical protein